MTQNELIIINGLKNRDEKIVKDFFFKKCRPMFNSIIKDYFHNDADYDELISCLYEYLIEDDAHRLDSFRGNDNSEAIYGWLRRTARNYFNEKKNREQVVGNTTSNPPMDELMDQPIEMSSLKVIKRDIKALLDQLRMKRDRQVIIKKEIEEKPYELIALEMGLSKADLYRIHNRAMNRLKKIARIGLSADDSLCAVRCEQYVLDVLGIHKKITELTRLAKRNGWLQNTGCRLEDLGRIPDYFGLKVKRTNGTLSDIENALNRNAQVILAVDGGELIGDIREEIAEDIIAGKVADHCVVALTCDMSENEVCLFDPAYGDIPLTIGFDRFLDAWSDSGYYMIIVEK